MPLDRIREVPNGVDATRFAPASVEERAALRRRLTLPADRPMVLFVGVVSPDKPDPSVVPQVTVIRAVHINELRAAVLELENS